MVRGWMQKRLMIWRRKVEMVSRRTTGTNSLAFRVGRSKASFRKETHDEEITLAVAAMAEGGGGKNEDLPKLEKIRLFVLKYWQMVHRRLGKLSVF